LFSRDAKKCLNPTDANPEACFGLAKDCKILFPWFCERGRITEKIWTNAYSEAYLNDKIQEKGTKNEKPRLKKPMSNSSIEFLHVSKDYQRHFWEKKVVAVSDCSFSVEKNAVTGFVGPNGAGKTTSIKLALGLARPTKGKVLVDGKDPRSPKSRQGISYLSERPYFYDHLTVIETLRFAFRLVKGHGNSCESQIRRALDEVELSASLSSGVKDLSKGMQQRLSMAQALLCDPELFILDEPMSGLDPLGRRLFRNILRKLGQDGKTVFFSSHILDDVEALCSKVIVMANGTVAYQGSLDAILSQASGDTECEVIGLSEEDRRHLGTLGYNVTSNPNGRSTILVPAGKEFRECQRYLYGKGLFCESGSKRSASLEDILYKQQQDKWR